MYNKRNMMNVFHLQNRLRNIPVFSSLEMRKNDQSMSAMKIGRWTKKQYLHMLRRGYYMFTTTPQTQELLYRAANTLIAPSYVSLESALQHYSLIPEAVFQITSVSTTKTMRFETPIAHFSYKHIQPTLFWGYRLLEIDSYPILMAQPEKALLDYMYFHPHIQTEDDFREMRMNRDAFKSSMNRQTLLQYGAAFQSKALLKRLHTFLRTIDHA
jgi:predicted transcriptional regulator of viral defense system